MLPLNEEDYRQVCEACDRVLLASDSTLDRVAIPWLHVLNEHPANLALYAGLYEGCDAGFRSLFTALKGLMLIAISFLKFAPSQRKSCFPPKADVVIFSHLLNRAQLGALEDFYFGQLPEELIAQGHATVVALHDHVGGRRKDVHLAWHAGMAPRILLPGLLGGFGEIRLRLRLLKEAGRLKQSAAGAVTDFDRRVYETAAEYAAGLSATATLRIYVQVQELVQAVRPNSIVVTYEGHAWERIVFAAARSVRPSIRCVGYHHAVLFPRQHAISRRLGSRYDPDVVCTAGHITEEILKKTSGLMGTPVTTVGTHRQESLDVPFAKKIGAQIDATCLVIPDGTMKECLLIFNFVLRVSIKMPAVTFLIRMHPVMPFETLVKADDRLRSLPKNVQISHEPINVDFERCRWAIYRGSGAAIRAVAVGLRPFYLKLADEILSIDPLYAMQTWRQVVQTDNDFQVALDVDLQSSIEVLEREWLPARDFCRQYYAPADLNQFCRSVVSELELE